MVENETTFIEFQIEELEGRLQQWDKRKDVVKKFGT
jgi:hypothetical protein